MTFPEWVRCENAIELIRLYGNMNGHADLSFVGDLSRGVTENGRLVVRQWGASALHFRLPEIIPPELDPVVVAAPAALAAAELMGAPELFTATHWLWVSADMPQRHAVLQVEEGLAWTAQVLREVEAALRLGWKKTPAEGK